mmetsp:Transcript_10620/g.12762  ORF Transcript_10620/g.12762 Transcript_10620/m.12762 type:complete len:181 (-) Transcript_10620:193-735(-)
MRIATTIFSLLVCQQTISAFTPTLSGSRQTSRAFGLNSKTALKNAVGIGSKFFQLQEMEDAETCETEIFFHQDGTLDCLETDGPPAVRAKGTWEEIGNDGVKFVLVRTYEAGAEKTFDTDMGEFTFDVTRSFTGTMAKVGAKTSVGGKITDIDGITGDSEVGYFEMIDTTEDRLKYGLDS